MLAHIINNAMLLIMAATALFYVPFAKTWVRAICAVFGLSLGWATLWLTTVMVYGEDSPPMVGAFFSAIMLTIYACILRGVKLLLFKIPFLANLEIVIRSKFGRPKNQERKSEQA